MKIYHPTVEEQRRYSPPRIAEATKTGVYGDPDFDLICTSHKMTPAVAAGVTDRVWTLRELLS
ncbi:MAG: hypothetical protein SGI92_09095 [Bryobacteraceae bacterium]|nr:hypothetical protein [Bryobacteraceae bacterium]